MLLTLQSMLYLKLWFGGMPNSITFNCTSNFRGVFWVNFSSLLKWFPVLSMILSTIIRLGVVIPPENFGFKLHQRLTRMLHTNLESLVSCIPCISSNITMTFPSLNQAAQIIASLLLFLFVCTCLNEHVNATLHVFELSVTLHLCANNYLTNSLGT